MRRYHKKASRAPLFIVSGIILIGGFYAWNSYSVPDFVFDTDEPQCPNGYVFQVSTICVPTPTVFGGSGGGGGGGDTTAPTVSISSPTNNQEFNSGTRTAIITGTASDDTELAYVEVAVNNGQFIVANGKNSWTSTAQNLADGSSYTVTVRAKDMAGNSKSASVLFKVKSTIIPPVDNWSDYHGVNFVTKVMRWEEDALFASSNSIPSDKITFFLDEAKKHNFNMLRIVGYQESYVGHKTEFLNELEFIVVEAGKRGIDVWYDNHQWKIGSAAYETSVGFPKAYLQGYNLSGPECSYDNKCATLNVADPDAVHFWRDLYTNKLRSGVNAHQGIADYLKTVAQRIDKYDNVVGYEILNEPQTTRVEDYTEMGKFNTFIAQQLRTVTQKDIYFSRDNGIVSDSVNPGWTWGGKNLERPKMIPQVQNVVYDNHIYNLDRTSTYASESLTAVGGRTDIKVMAGEWSSLNNAETFLRAFKQGNVASTYWAYGCFGCQATNSLISSTGALSQSGINYKSAIEAVYN